MELYLSECEKIEPMKKNVSHPETKKRNIENRFNIFLDKLWIINLFVNIAIRWMLVYVERLQELWRFSGMQY